MIIAKVDREQMMRRKINETFFTIFVKISKNKDHSVACPISFLRRI